MDSITQAALGASIGISILGKNIGKKSIPLGAAIATIPDLDVILYLFYSKYEMLSIHRGLSHSIIFNAIMALLIALILSKVKWLKNISYKRLLLFTALCLFTHILLDTFTAYGTQLLLPFSNKRLGFDSINVVDPVYTIPLLIGIVLSLKQLNFSERTNHFSFNTYGLIISSLYLVFTLFNKAYVETQISSQFKKQNITYNSLLTVPVGIANKNWYGVAKTNDSIYMLKHAVFSNETPLATAFPINEAYLNEINGKVANKMRWFAKGFYTVEKHNNSIRIYNLQVDMRGITKSENKLAPTKGYFEIATQTNTLRFSTGSIE